LTERDNLQDVGVDGKNVKWILKKLDEDVDWLLLAQYRDQRRALVVILFDHLSD
jgi:hypothetical protein